MEMGSDKMTRAAQRASALLIARAANHWLSRFLEELQRDWNSLGDGSSGMERAAGIYRLLETKILEQTRQVKRLIS